MMKEITGRIATSKNENDGSDSHFILVQNVQATLIIQFSVSIGGVIHENVWSMFVGRSRFDLEF